jgi:putative hydrolase of the HAD superfamily
MGKPIFKPFSDKNIKNIIFDLGGVIINLSYQRTIDAFKSIGFENFDRVFTQANQTDIFDKMDKGLISPMDFRATIKAIFNVDVSDSQIDHAWNAMLLDFPAHRLELLERIKAHYCTFLLSNTNEIHFIAYNNMLKETFGFHNLSHYFNKEYYSHLVHMRKPDPEVFLHIMEENGLKADETLFIDDSIQHVEGAKKLGILAYHLDIPKGESIEGLFV